MRAQPLSPGLDRLLALCPQVESASYRWSFVKVGWDRPHGELVLAGAGSKGRGELLSFTEAEHERFRLDVLRFTPGRRSPADLPDGEPYARCAWEAALLDLGLRQRGLSLAQVFGAPERARLRVCHSFRALPSPRPAGTLKLDHQPGANYAELPVAVVDFKGRSHLAPGVTERTVLEDPSRPVRAPWSLDQSVRTPADLHHPRLGRPTCVNLKAGRMGGFLATLRAAVAARRLGIQPYWGGQWELGVGRRQAQQLAALVCPDAWNDLASGAAGYRAQDPEFIDVPLAAPGLGPTEA